ncbi:acetyl-CoA C-acyltransferase [Lactobacillus bombicola]|uniref:acetyl-CoA C-acetyltransferase n=1 Tax=Lactobacillus bombicola TaxID=1505723 RepID=A0ABX9LWN5_9LACO|nr:thiolase family protein [Lactobacillus bombicola]RHW53534.1 acetyl-CoA C-acyltransferase [Lactobacillus bombicola]
MKDIFIVAAKRTPFGRYRGLFAQENAVDLGTIALRETLKSIGLKATELDALFMGNVLSAGLGQNMARQVSLKAGMSQKSTSVTINDVCGSSLKALRLAQGQMELGDFDLVAVGGSESMTNAVYYAKDKHDSNLQSEMLNNGLTDAFSGLHMGLTAEKVADKYHVLRSEMDEYSLNSHQKATRAVKNGYFENEIIKITHGKEVIDWDENIRADTSMDALNKLKPVFKEHGQITAGNASPLSDGASIVILATQEKVKELNLQPLARLGAYTEAGTDPAYMGFAPYFAVKKLLDISKRQIADYDVIEVNEAFAAPSIALAKALSIPMDKLNIFGGAIAIGHPLAATGTRLVATAINELQHVTGKTALVTLCIGGGQAIAYEINRDF